MAKIVVECGDPNDLDEVEAIMDQVAGKCNITYFKQHQGMVEAGTSKSKSESARIMAKDIEETPQAIRRRIQIGEKETAQVGQQKSNFLQPIKIKEKKEKKTITTQKNSVTKPLCKMCKKRAVVFHQRTKKYAKHGLCIE